MKSIELMTVAHGKQATRPRRATWFDEDHVSEPVETIGMLVTAPACTVGEAARLADVCRMILEENVEAVAVVDASAALCGLITSADLLRGGDDWTAADAMSSVLSVRASTPLEIVVDLMAREHAEHVVVTDAVGQVVGVVAVRDVARHHARY